MAFSMSIIEFDTAVYFQQLSWFPHFYSDKPNSFFTTMKSPITGKTLYFSCQKECIEKVNGTQDRLKIEINGNKQEEEGQKIGDLRELANQDIYGVMHCQLPPILRLGYQSTRI